MNFFCDSGGNIFHVDSEKVYQGSVNANKIYFIGAFPSNCEVLVRYTLPNGIYSEQELCTKTTDTRLLEMHDKNGQEYNVWEVSLHKIVTQYFGTVAVQFSVVGSNGLLATALSSFEILRGVPVVIDTEDKDTLVTQILQLVSELDIGTIRNMLETYQAKVEDLAKNLDTTQYIKKDEFNDKVIKSLTNNERGLSNIEKYNACEWLGAVSNTTPTYYYDECAGGIATMYNSKNDNRPTHVLLWDQMPSSDELGSERTIKLPNEDGRLLTEEKAEKEYVKKQTTANVRVYALTSSGDTTYGIANTVGNAGENMLPWYIRSDSNQLDSATDWNKVSLFTHTPQKAYAAANKKYVDDAVANAGGKLYRHRGWLSFSEFSDNVSKTYNIWYTVYTTNSMSLTIDEWLRITHYGGYSSPNEEFLMVLNNNTTYDTTWHTIRLLRMISASGTFSGGSQVTLVWQEGSGMPDEHNLDFITIYDDYISEI